MSKLPVYDDWGNHIDIAPKERTFERKQGCWNCVSFDTSLMFQQRTRDCYTRDVAAFLERGLPMPAAHAKARATRDLLRGKAGIFGFCLKGQAPGEFVACKHLCASGWSGRIGVTGSFEPGKAWDEPVAALYADKGVKISDDGEVIRDEASEPRAPQAQLVRPALVIPSSVQTAERTVGELIGAPSEGWPATPAVATATPAIATATPATAGATWPAYTTVDLRPPVTTVTPAAPAATPPAGLPDSYADEDADGEVEMGDEELDDES
jgi:hypothetical protein